MLSKGPGNRADTCTEANLGEGISFLLKSAVQSDREEIECEILRGKGRSASMADENAGKPACELHGNPIKLSEEQNRIEEDK